MEVKKNSLVTLELEEINTIKSQIVSDYDSNNERRQEIQDLELNPATQSAATIASQNIEKKEIYLKQIDELIHSTVMENAAAYRINENLRKEIYKLSMIFTGIGFFFILIASIIFFVYADDNRPFADSLGALVIIPNLIAALLFVLHQRATELSKYYYEKIENSLNLRTANMYISGLQIDTDRIELRKEIIKSLIIKSTDMT